MVGVPVVKPTRSEPLNICLLNRPTGSQVASEFKWWIFLHPVEGRSLGGRRISFGTKCENSTVKTV